MLAGKRGDDEEVAQMNRVTPHNLSSLPFHVYLSHAHEDFLLVDRVWKVLDRMGLRAYMYEHFPHPGQSPRKRSSAQYETPSRWCPS